jgi:hypothetical protein
VVINCKRNNFIGCSVHSSFLLLAYKHWISYVKCVDLSGQQGISRQKENFTFSVHSTVMQKGQASEPVSQRAHLLDPNKILQLFMDRDNNESPGRYHCCRG